MKQSISPRYYISGQLSDGTWQRFFGPEKIKKAERTLIRLLSIKEGDIAWQKWMSEAEDWRLQDESDVPDPTEPRLRRRRRPAKLTPVAEAPKRRKKRPEAVVVRVKKRR